MAALAGPAPAQVANGAVFGDWTVTCTAESTARTLCALSQTAVTRDGGTFLAEVGLNPAEGAVVMVVRTPSGMLLPVQPAWRVGSGDPVALAWRTCAGDFCTAVAALTPEQVDQLRRGRTMILGYRRTGDDAPVTFEVSLTGVTAGLAALEQR
jgi:invasion protein IalB